MSEQFKVNEIVIGQNFIVDTQFNGMEAIIIGGLEMRPWSYEDTGESGESLAYEVEWENGEVTVQEPFTLRRKPPTTGEASVLALFRVTPRHTSAPATSTAAA
jgi:hypothetical protein